MTDWIEGYKLGFKAGVIAFRTQVEDKAFKTIKCVNGVEVMPPVNYSLSPAILDKICKELQGETE
jgi:hypothetical protein